MCAGNIKGQAFCLALTFFIVSTRLSNGESNAFVENRQCAVFYSEENFTGSEFVLKDFDQSVNTKRDYRSSISGWQKTRSIRIEQNCLMNVCTGTYFHGTCHSLPAGQMHNAQLIANINSANCTCARECNCEKIHIPKNWWSCGRAYPRCNKCDSEYFHLRYENRFGNFPIAESIERIILRTGCNLTVWTNYGKTGESKVIRGHTATAPGRIRSYQCACDDAAYVPTKRPNLYPQIVELPEGKEQLISLSSSNLTAAKHPGLQAAFTSSKNGWSSRNAYIILIGVHNPDRIGLYGCSGKLEKIGECHFAVGLDKLGVSNAQLRVIYANIGGADGDLGQKHDDRWAATLADYLFNHEELKDSVPNTVVLFHEPMNDDTIAEEDSKFQRKLKFLNSLRPLILTNDYSNIVFYLVSLYDLQNAEQKNPEETVERFEKAIRKRRVFLEPTIILPMSSWTSDDPMINGHCRMPNGEYTPRNLQDGLKLISEKSGDPLGHAIFDAAFPFERQQKGVMHKVIELSPSNQLLPVRNLVGLGKLQSESKKFKIELAEGEQSLKNYKSLANKQRQNLENRITASISKLNEKMTEQKVSFVTKMEGKKQQMDEELQQIKAELNKEKRAKEEMKMNFETKIVQLTARMNNEKLENEKRTVKLAEEMQNQLASGFDEEKLAREAEMKRIQKEIWEKIKLDLNKLFE